ncbi:ATP-binding protein [Pelomonas sp. KK5]|uniref:ATP-binding protein n=1 Tax=Pelomonas sp. KK5 TaxID=1855730 RepID=UPI00097C6318|nr:ATP-binding protein [Pelomonas sp. KK5]
MSIPPSEEEDLSSLPAWAMRAMQGAGSPPLVPETKNSLDDSPVWPLLLDAAVVSTFMPSQLAKGLTIGIGRPDAEKTVLQFSEPSITASGTEWELRRDARTEVLRLASGSSELAAAVARTATLFADPVSEALRLTISGQTLVDASMALPRLEALRVATSVLSGVDTVTPPLPLNQLDGLIRKRRMVEQFERVCGKDYERDVVGRGDELERLRAFVGVISAKSLVDTVSRGFAHLKRALTGRKPLVLWGTGGVGKTTLLSRFMLEHMNAADRKYPIAYLDFDRPSISPKDHFGMFAEICQQVSAQFEELEAGLSELRNRALALQSESIAQGPESGPLLREFVEAFRQQVDTLLDRLERAFEWQRPVLIVLDTFEIVQYDANQVAHIERFLRPFLTADWRRLRLVISGRRRLDDFESEVDQEELKGIDVHGAATLLGRLAERASKSMSPKVALELAEKLATRRKGLTLEKLRVHPLRIRMASSLLSPDCPESGDEIARSILSELASGETGDAATCMINGILIRRILNHVRDDRVRALADPGLVVRRITPEVIVRVMGPGTPAPDPAIPGFDPSAIDEEQAQDIFNAFSSEVSLVERDLAALRHRQDVRNEMLPLIRLRDRPQFDLLHDLAFDHFSEKAAKGDPAAAAEAVYHGLWRGESFEALDRLWTVGRVTDARIDPEEFAAGSDAELFLKTRNREGLSPDDVRRLPHSMALEWATGFSNQFLLSDQPMQAVETIRAALGPAFEHGAKAPVLVAVAARLLFRAGRWKDCRALISRALHELPESRGASRNARADLLRLAIHIAAKSGDSAAEISEAIEYLHSWDAVVCTEATSFLLIGRLQKNVRMTLKGLREMQGGDIAQVSDRRWNASRHILRWAILASPRAERELVAKWVQLSRFLPRVRSHRLRDPQLATVLKDVLGTRPPDDLDERDRIWQKRSRMLSTAVRESGEFIPCIRYLMVFDHGDWNLVFEHALATALSGGEPGLREYLGGLEFLSSRSVAAGDIMFETVRSGRFLELAKALSKWRSERQTQLLLSDSEGIDAYPQTISNIAIALLRWHETLKELALQRGWNS